MLKDVSSSAAALYDGGGEVQTLTSSAQNTI